MNQTKEMFNYSSPDNAFLIANISTLGDNFPVDVMRQQRGVGMVIGVDLSNSKVRRIEFDEMPSAWTLVLDRLRPRKHRRYKLPSLANLLINTTVLYSTSRQKQAKALTDLYFNPPLDRVGMLEWSKYDSVVEQGYQHAVQTLRADDAAAVPAAGS